MQRPPCPLGVQDVSDGERQAVMLPGGGFQSRHVSHGGTEPRGVRCHTPVTVQTVDSE